MQMEKKLEKIILTYLAQCSSAVMCDWTFDTDIVNGGYEVGQSWDETLCSFDQW